MTTKPFKILRDKMPLKAREEVDRRVKKIIEEMELKEIKKKLNCSKKKIKK